MPVRDLWGVGPATEAKLSQIGIETVGDLAAQPPDRLIAALGTGSGAQLHRLAHAIDDRPVVVDQRAKSIGHEETFPKDLTDPDVVGRELVRMVDAVASRLHRSGVVGRTVTLKVRYGDFTTITRSSNGTQSGRTGREPVATRMKSVVTCRIPAEVSIATRCGPAMRACPQVMSTPAASRRASMRSCSSCSRR